MSEGLASLEEAFAMAESESGLGDLDDDGFDLPSELSEDDTPGEQADESDIEHPEVDDADRVDDDLQALLDDLESSEDDEATEEGEESPNAVAEFLASDEFWGVQVQVDTVDGPQNVTLRDMYDGFMRQSDYTKKTQEVAEQRKQNEKAVEFFEAFMKDPIEFVTELAVRAELVEPGTKPRSDLQIAKWQTPEELEAEISKRVEERLQQDPRFHQAQIAAAREAVNSVFTSIEQARGVTISPQLRQQVIDEAARRGTGDLELVFDAFVARRQQQRSRAKEAAQAAPKRAQRSGASDEATPKQPQSVADAMRLALLELGQ